MSDDYELDSTGLLDAIRQAATSASSSSRPLYRNDPDDVLGDDIMAIRDSVLGAGSNGSAVVAATPEQSTALYDALTKKFQVDLNSENQVKNLEDPALTSHMEAARGLLNVEMMKLSELPSREELAQQYVKCRQLNSSSLQTLDSSVADMTMLIDELSLRADHLGVIASGGKAPHGFPAQFPDNILHMKGKLEKLAADLAEKNKAITQSYKNFLIVRREYEAVADGREKLFKYYEQKSA
jgi:hypothetical protein